MRSREVNAKRIDLEKRVTHKTDMKHVFDIWPDLRTMAADLGKPYSTVASWRQRGSIPAKYDLDIVRAARGRGIELTLEALAEARAVPDGGAAA